MARERSSSFPPVPSEEPGLLDGALRAAFPKKRGPVPRDPVDGPQWPARARGDGEREDGAPRYRVVGRIGRGGVGVVLRVRDADLGRDVAMKVLSARHREHPSLVARFLEEARIGGRLQHPGIVPVYEMGIDGGRRPYFTMRPVEGRTLREVLADRTDPARDRPELLRIFEKVCQAVAYAHARGVVHRDLKPSNVMVGSFGEVQVLDWGFAKVLDSRADVDPAAAGPGEPGRAVRDGAGRGRSESAAGFAFGTPAYMPPEQAAGNLPATDARSDVFALGGILCEILTGDPPYAGGDAGVTLRAAGTGDLADAAARLDRSGADPELVDLAKRCLRPDRRERPEDGGRVADAVSRQLASLDRRMRDAEVQAARADARAVQERRLRRLSLGLAGSVVALVVLAGSWILQQEYRSAAERERFERWVSRRLDEADALADGGEMRRAAEELEGVASRIQGIGVDEESRALVASRLEEYRRRDGVAVLVRRVQGIRSAQDVGGGSADREYEAAFREAGVDLEAMAPKDVAGWILATGHSASAELVRALDHWLSRIPDGSGRAANLVAAANLADPDEWRSRLRLALSASDAGRLRALAEEAEETALRPESTVLLGRAMSGSSGSRDYDAAAVVLREGCRRHPGDVWIRFQLALVEARRSGGDLDEAVLHARIAQALWPENPAVRSALAYVLARRALEGPGRRGDVAEARRIVEQVCDSDPGLVLARIALCGCLLAEGEVEVSRRLADGMRGEASFSETMESLIDPLFRGR